ncbi:MAG: response regulator [Candidatus Saccharimonas sp.]
MTQKGPVLIIDDDEWLASCYKTLLEAAGYTVQVARHALEAMERISHALPKAIVLDIFMAGPNGIVFLHELRSHTDLSQIPVIVCSNSVPELRMAPLESYGVVRLLDKTTMQPQDVVTAVRGVVQNE